MMRRALSIKPRVFYDLRPYGRTAEKIVMQTPMGLPFAYDKSYYLVETPTSIATLHRRGGMTSKEHDFNMLQSSTRGKMEVGHVARSMYTARFVMQRTPSPRAK